ALAETTVPVEQRHHPVADRDAETERGAVEDRQPVELPVEQDARPFLSARPGTPLVRRRRSEENKTDHGNRNRSRIRRAPAQEVLDLRDDCERDPAAREPGTPEEALCRRGAADGAD